MFHGNHPSIHDGNCYSLHHLVKLKNFCCLILLLFLSAYSTRFPETLIPTFKVAEAKCLQKVRIGEDISLVRFVITLLNISFPSLFPTEFCYWVLTAEC